MKKVYLPFLFLLFAFAGPLHAFAQADLVPEAPVVDNGMIAPGNEVTITATIRNDGDQVAGAYNIDGFRIQSTYDGYVWSDDGFGYTYDSEGNGYYAMAVVDPGRVTASTVAGGEQTISITFTLPSTYEVVKHYEHYRVGYTVDSDSEVAESNESNNFSGWTNFHYADLVSQPATVSPTPIEPGSTVNIFAHVDNVGEVTAYDFNIFGFFVDYDENGDGTFGGVTANDIYNSYYSTPLYEYYVPAGYLGTEIPAGGSASKNVSWQMPADAPEGHYRVVYFSDWNPNLEYSQDVAESDDWGNNEPSFTEFIVSTEKPDLVPGNLVLNSGTLTQGGAVTFSAAVDNQGTLDADPFETEFSYQYGGALGSWTVFDGFGHTAMPVAESPRTDVSTALSIPSDETDDLYVQYCVDSQMQLNEGTVGEANNCTQIGPLAIDVIAPDVMSVDGSITLTSDPGDLVAGKTVTFEADVTNGGGADATNFHDNFTYLWAPEDPENPAAVWTQFGSHIVENTLAVGATLTDASGGLTLGQSGTLYIQHCADSQGEIAESSSGETNNCTYASYSVAPAPTATISVDPTEVLTGSSTEVTWSSSNASYCEVRSYDTGDTWTGLSGTEASAALSDTSRFYVSCDFDDFDAEILGLVDATTFFPSQPVLSVGTHFAKEDEPVTITWDLLDNDPENCSLISQNDVTPIVNGGTQITEVVIVVKGTTNVILDCGVTQAEDTIRLIPSVRNS